MPGFEIKGIWASCVRRNSHESRVCDTTRLPGPRGAHQAGREFTKRPRIHQQSDRQVTRALGGCHELRPQTHVTNVDSPQPGGLDFILRNRLPISILHLLCLLPHLIPFCKYTLTRFFSQASSRKQAGEGRAAAPSPPP